MSRYINGRQPIEDISEDLLENSLNENCVNFGEDWLLGTDDNPLQILWKRDDPLATFELYSFGNSLLTLKDKNKSWLKRNIEKTKGNDINNRAGAAFEIMIAAAFLAGLGNNVILPSGDNPG